MVRTLSEAINIGVPYNFERVLYFLTMDSEATRKMMEQVDATSELTVSGTVLSDLQATIATATVSDELSKSAPASAHLAIAIDPQLHVRTRAHMPSYHRVLMRADHRRTCPLRCVCPLRFVSAATVMATTRAHWEEHRYLVDPHTAVCLAAADALDLPRPGTARTAHPSSAHPTTGIHAMHIHFVPPPWVASVQSIDQSRVCINVYTAARRFACRRRTRASLKRHL
jgi:threonine synthase